MCESPAIRYWIIIAFVIPKSCAVLNTGDAQDTAQFETYLRRNSDGIVRSLYNDAVTQSTIDHISDLTDQESDKERQLQASLDSLANVRRSFFYEVPRVSRPRFEALTGNGNRSYNNMYPYHGIEKENDSGIVYSTASRPGIAERISFVTEPNLYKEQRSSEQYYPSYRDQDDSDRSIYNHRGTAKYSTPFSTTTENYFSSRGRSLDIPLNRGSARYGQSIIPPTTYRPPYKDFPDDKLYNYPTYTPGLQSRIGEDIRGNVRYIDPYNDETRQVEIKPPRAKSFYFADSDPAKGITYSYSYDLNSQPRRRIYPNTNEAYPSSTEAYGRRYGVNVSPGNYPPQYISRAYGGVGTERPYTASLAQRISGYPRVINPTTALPPLSSTYTPNAYSAQQGVQETEENDGSYFFTFNAGDHARQESRDRQGRVVGSYSYLSDDGQMKVVQYEADSERGFIARGDDIPIRG